MAIGERIRFFRKKAGLTQKQLGLMVGFPENSAEVRIAQYERGTRAPKNDLIKKLSRIFNVSPDALCVPNIDNENSLLFTLFTLEDMYGFKVCRSGPYIYLIAGDLTGPPSELNEKLLSWSHYAEMLKDDKISKEEYNRWRYSISAGPQQSGAAKHKRGTNRKSPAKP